MDGNFSAQHLKSRRPDLDVLLTDGDGFMVKASMYDAYLKDAEDSKTVGFILCISLSTAFTFRMLEVFL